MDGEGLHDPTLSVDIWGVIMRTQEEVWGNGGGNLEGERREKSLGFSERERGGLFEGKGV